MFEHNKIIYNCSLKDFLSFNHPLSYTLIASINFNFKIYGNWFYLYIFLTIYILYVCNFVTKNYYLENIIYRILIAEMLLLEINLSKKKYLFHLYLYELIFNYLEKMIGTNNFRIGFCSQTFDEFCGIFGVAP